MTQALRGTFIGNFASLAQSGAQRLSVLRSMGVIMNGVDTTALPPSNPVSARARRLLGLDPASQEQVEAYNRLVVRATEQDPGDFVWLEWPRLMEAVTLHRLKERWPNCQLVCFQDDNPFGTRRFESASWERFIANIPLYDVHLVKRPSDIVEIRARGAKRVELFMHGVFEPLFHPAPTPWPLRWPVSFVGTPHDHRVTYIAQLLRRGVPVHVFGGKWQRTLVRWRHGKHFEREQYGEDYVRVLWQSAVCLAFISSSNRDEYSMRTFEIPGCGAFFLGERTPTHLELFEEGKEAEFFGSVDECAEKIRFYLANEAARARIATGGYERCRRSDYRLVRRMHDVLAVLFPARAGALRLSPT